VITLNRLNRILRVDPAQRLAVVEPGVINTAVTVAAAPHGLHYAPDPSSQSICTIGGNVAFNSGGAHCLKYGMTSNHVLGLKAVLATGEVVEFGSASREQLGPDWCGLFSGNEGLFGIALEITVQLLPRAEVFHTVLAGYRTKILNRPTTFALNVDNVQDTDYYVSATLNTGSWGAPRSFRFSTSMDF
jgi:glycolate oxidase